ncbi:MAG: PhzF family phenazine biosynthesis protein, partial [Bacillota bacterium]|nr:PhzF family phenazine biosynthesis protein [Bacillota bacterium]
ELSKKYDVVGVHAFTLEGCSLDGAKSEDSTSQAAAYCRNFAPLYDIDEEAATGTANGALTYYLYKNGLTGSGGLDNDAPALHREFTFLQGEAMDRPSEILSRLSLPENDKPEDGKSPSGAPAVRIRVGGSAAILAKGEIQLCVRAL